MDRSYPSYRTYFSSLGDLGVLSEAGVSNSDSLADAIEDDGGVHFDIDIDIDIDFP